MYEHASTRHKHCDGLGPLHIDVHTSKQHKWNIEHYALPFKEILLSHSKSDSTKGLIHFFHFSRPRTSLHDTDQYIVLLLLFHQT